MRLKAEMLFERGNASQYVIDFLGKARRVLGSLFERFEAFPDIAQLHFDIGQPTVDCVEATIHCIEAPVNSHEPLIDFFKSLMDALKFVEHYARKALKIVFGHIRKL